MIVEMEMENSGEDTAYKNAEKEVEEKEMNEGGCQGDKQGDKGKNSKTAKKKGQNIQNKGRKGKGKDSGCTQSRRDSEDGQYKGSSVPVKQSNQNKDKKTTEDSRQSRGGGSNHSETNKCRQSQESSAKGIGEAHYCGLKGVPLSTEKKDRPKVFAC